jgi:hypothetical protein
MANLTLSIEDQLLEKTRKRAAEMGTTVNQMTRDHFQSVVGEEDIEGWIEEFLSLTGNGHSGGEKFDREEIYDGR